MLNYLCFIQENQDQEVMEEERFFWKKGER